MAQAGRNDWQWPPDPRWHCLRDIARRQRCGAACVGQGGSSIVALIECERRQRSRQLRFRENRAEWLAAGWREHAIYRARDQRNKIARRCRECSDGWRPTASNQYRIVVRDERNDDNRLAATVVY